jgi:phosphoenolpyruvate synthase/pyruvate phosphate dikinase
MDVMWFADIGQTSLPQVGGKAASLGELARLSEPVPSGFVISTSVYHTGLTPDICDHILKSFDKLGASHVAVRSSAVAEDSVDASWAGQLESYLNVERNGVIAAVKDCWNSMESKRAEEYASRNQVTHDHRAVAVIVQKMVDSELAGVMFTANPVTQEREQVVIEAVRGLGELLVQGAETPESLIIDKSSGKVVEHSLGAQSNMLIYRDGLNVVVPVPADMKEDTLLVPSLIHKLMQSAIKIEGHYRVPQDIEWAVQKKQLFIVQSRPISTMKAQDVKKA